MKIHLTFKTPDVLDQVSGQLGHYDDETDRIKDDLGHWIKWSEYLRVEYDTELKTMVVVQP